MKPRFRKIIGWTLLIFLLVSLAALGSLFWYQNAYAGKIYKNVSVAGVDLSGKTKKQAGALLSKKYESILSQQIDVSAGDKKVTLPLSQTGMGFDTESAINEAYQIGRPEHFMSQLYASAKTTLIDKSILVKPKIDRTKFNIFVAEKIPGLNIEATDAALQISNGEVAITPEKDGQIVDISNLADQITHLASSINSRKLILKTKLVSANINSSALSLEKDKAENYIRRKITLAYQDKSISPSEIDISRWLKIGNTNGKAIISLDDSSIKIYLAGISKSFEIQKKDRKINALDNSILDEGLAGLYLDNNKSTADIKNAIETNGQPLIALTTYNEPPKEIKVFPAEGIVPGRFAGKYIDIDLTQQKLCRIEANAIIDCFIISSGKPSTPTPPGTRYIENKSPRAWSAPHGLWMPWWQSLGGGYGIHELPEWPGGFKEGEAHLGTPVSHGCVRLGIGSAELVYNWTEIGTPVYIHK